MILKFFNELKLEDVPSGDKSLILKKEYRRLSFIHHPDRGGSHEDMQQLNEEYKFLCRGGEGSRFGSKFTDDTLIDDLNDWLSVQKDSNEFHIDPKLFERVFVKIFAHLAMNLFKR